MTACLKCDSTDAGLFRGDDGLHRMQCPDCGYEWGPFVSSHSRTNRAQESKQAEDQNILDWCE